MIVSVNTNNFVKVRLTLAGRRILRNHYEELAKEANRKADTLNPDELLRKHEAGDGLHKFQMWDLMNIFGQHMYMGAPQVFQKNEILV